MSIINIKQGMLVLPVVQTLVELISQQKENGSVIVDCSVQIVWAVLLLKIWYSVGNAGSTEALTVKARSPWRNLKCSRTKLQFAFRLCNEIIKFRGRNFLIQSRPYNWIGYRILHVQVNILCSPAPFLSCTNHYGIVKWIIF